MSSKIAKTQLGVVEDMKIGTDVEEDVVDELEGQTAKETEMRSRPFRNGFYVEFSVRSRLSFLP